MPQRRLAIYGAIVLILLIQFAMRADNPTEQPFFWDENRHITRAASILEGVHPAKESNGKFLLYVYLAPFQPDRDVALHVSRTAVALFSLVGSAGAFAVGRRLFGTEAALIAIAFYAFVPFALFYERMALADGMAGALATLTAYACIRLAQSPGYRWGIIAGGLGALASMAKVAVGFASVLLPLLAVYTLGHHPQANDPKERYSQENRSQEKSQPFIQWLVARWKHYWWYWVAAGVTYIGLWLPTLIPAFVSGLRGSDYVLFDATSIDTSFLSQNDSTRYNEFHRQIATMISWPMLGAVIIVTLLGVWKFPRRAWLLIGWITLIWGPTALLVWRTQTRYLMAGVLPMAILLGGGASAVAQWHRWSPIGGQRAAWAVLILFLAGWILAFAGPFAYYAGNDPTALVVTRWDDRDYFQSPWNGYGLREALYYLQGDGEPGEDGTIEVMMVAQMCPFMDLYRIDTVRWTCITGAEGGKDYDGSINSPMWQSATNFALTRRDKPIYLVLEQHRNTLEIPTVPFQHPELHWEEIQRFQRPHDGLWVTVWRVTGVPSTQ